MITAEGIGRRKKLWPVFLLFALLLAVVTSGITAVPPTAAAAQQLNGETADEFSMPHTAAKALACYESLIDLASTANAGDFERWGHLLHLIEAEWDIARGIASATGAALSSKQPADRRPS